MKLVISVLWREVKRDAARPRSRWERAHTHCGVTTSNSNAAAPPAEGPVTTPPGARDPVGATLISGSLGWLGLRGRLAARRLRINGRGPCLARLGVAQ